MSRAARVLMTADAVGGVFNYALQLARGLSEHGWEVILAVMGPRASEAQRAQAQAIPGLTWAEAPYRLEWMDHPWSDVRAAGAWLLELEARYAPQLVHLNGYSHGALPFRAPVVVVGHSCVLSWWRAVLGEEAPARYEVYRQHVRAGLRGADRVVAPTSAMRAALLRHYGPFGSSEVLYNGCSSSPRAAAKRPRIAAAGRVWDQAKNLRALIEAAPSVPWQVSIAGELTAPDGHVFRSAPGVELLGVLPHERVGAMLAESSIFAAPARYEPFGLAILEAASAGCALVLGDIPSLRELWHGAARFVSDDASLARVLGELCGDAVQRKQLARAALARASSFSHQRFVAAYLTLYTSMIERGRRGRASGASYRLTNEVAACVSSASITR